MIEMIILGGKTTIIWNNIFALCLHQVCAVAHADHATRNHNCLKIVLILKLHILRHLPVSSTIKHFFSKKQPSQFILVFLLCFFLKQVERMFQCCLDQFSVFFCLFVCLFFFFRLEELGYNTGEHKFTKNPLINFRAILLAILGHVVPNRRADIRQYTPSVLIFFLRYLRGKKAWQKVNRVSLFSVSIWSPLII